MSKYDWERGTLKLSNAEFSRVFKAFRDIVSKARLKDLETATKLHAAIVAKAKGQRGVVWSNIFDEVISQQGTSRPTWGYAVPVPLFDFQVTARWNVKQAMVTREVPNPDYGVKPYAQKTLRVEGSPLKPKKGDYAAVTAKEQSFFVFDDEGYDCATICFEPKDKTITWCVTENNLAVERAHQGWLAVQFFKLLDGVNWTRSTGGTLVGNDEYNRVSYDAGGGGNYITRSYGPLGEQARDAQWRGWGLPARKRTASTKAKTAGTPPRSR